MQTQTREPEVLSAEAAEPAAHALAAVTPTQMLAIALERGETMERLQQLMDLQERWEANNARKAFVAAMATFKRNPPEILKRKHVEFQTSKGLTAYDHATLADVCSAAIAGLAEVGISHNWDVQQSQGLVKVTCVLTHEGGHQEKVSLHSAADESGGKNAIQALGSAITYLQRYTLLAATGLAAADADDDGMRSGARSDAEQPARGKPPTQEPRSKATGSAPKLATPKQVELVRKRLDASGIRERDFLGRFEIGDFPELPFERVDEALNWIKQVAA